MMKNKRERTLKKTLAQFVQPMRNLPFEDVVSGLYDVTVEKFDIENENNRKILHRLAKAMRDACKTIQSKPIERPRANEVGNDMEKFVIAALRKEHFEALRPKTKDGKGKSVGYPDIKISTADLPIYLEVKTFSARNYSTTQRSFYISPAENPKIIDDAYHLLVGFEMAKKGDLYTPEAFEIVDLYGLKCDVKLEVNSHNKKLYEDERILAKERVS